MLNPFMIPCYLTGLPAEELTCKGTGARLTPSLPTCRGGTFVPPPTSLLLFFLPAGQLIDANAGLVLDLARPFAQNATIDNLIALRPGQPVG